MKKCLLWAGAFYLGSLPTAASSWAGSFIGHPYACPSVAAIEKAHEAFRQLDEDRFEDTNCVSMQPDIPYLVVRCEEGVLDQYVSKFGYPIPRTTDLPRLMCELLVEDANGSLRKLLIEFAHMFLLKPK